MGAHASFIRTIICTVFCDSLYDRSTLMTKYARQRQEPAEGDREFPPKPRPDCVPRNLGHYKTLVSILRTDDHAYQAQPVRDLAKNKGTSWTFVNADSYYVQ